MYLRIVEWSEDPNGSISYRLRVSANGEEIGMVSVTVANPSLLNIRTAQRAALMANTRIRAQYLAERQQTDLENG